MMPPMVRPLLARVRALGVTLVALAAVGVARAG